MLTRPLSGLGIPAWWIALICYGRSHLRLPGWNFQITVIDLLLIRCVRLRKVERVDRRLP